MNIREWLNLKLSETEKTISARKQMEESWRGGTDASWRAVGCRLNKAARTKEAESHMRIAQRIQADVDGFRALIEILSERDSLRQQNEQLLKEIEELKANQKESQ